MIELGAGFHPDLTGRENVFLNGTILGIDRQTIARRFDEIVAFSELDHFIDTPVKRYSSGMIIRLGFAVASCIEPEILLVDEVLAVGDAAFQQKCLKRIRTLVDNGTSIIFVSHNFYLVQAVCNRALYLQQGQVKEFGTAKEVIARYEHDLHQERAQKFAEAQENSSTGQSFVVNGTISADDVEVTKVEVLPIVGVMPSMENGHFDKNDEFSSKEAVRIRVHYNAYKALGKVQASVFIMRSDGLTCCMMRTKLDNVDFTIEQGKGVITVDLTPLQLISGTYYAEAWILNASDSMVLNSTAGRSDWFTVRGAAFSYEESSGIFEPRTQWSHAENGLPVQSIDRNISAAIGEMGRSNGHHRGSLREEISATKSAV